MTSGPFPRSGEQAVLRLYFNFVEPTEIACRKRRRMAYFGIQKLDDLACGEIDLAPGSPGCIPVCAEIVEAHRAYLAKYLFCGERRLSLLWRAIPSVIDLDRYPDFETYAESLKRRRQEIERARRRGFHSRPFDRNLYRFELFEVDTSLRFRSGGPVPAAFLRRPPERVSSSVIRTEPSPPSCQLHWYYDLGVFAPAHGEATTEDRLVGYLFLKRVGSVVRLTALMGHGEHLADGVVKLLFADGMRWLLGRGEARVRGVRYLHYGAIEHGGPGLVAWKQRFQFKPLLFSWRKTETLDLAGGASAHRCVHIFVGVLTLLTG
jgi:hypothetical protein